MLTPEEIKTLTARTKPFFQKIALENQGTPFTEDADGRPVVFRVHLTGIPMKRKKAEPKWKTAI